MQIGNYPQITTLATGDYFLVQTASDNAYKYIKASDMQAFFGGGGSTTVLNTTALLMNFDGTNNSTTFTDVKGNAISSIGSPVISTTQSKFGGSSLYLNGSSYIYTPLSSLLTFGSNDYTLEGWVYMPTPGSTNYMQIMGDAVGGGSGNAGMFLAVNAGKLVFRHWINSTSMAAHPTAITANTWHHVAATKKGTVTNVYLDGVIGTAGVIESTNTDEQFSIGSVPNNGGYATNFVGYIDSLRVTNGASLYSANFTPPTAAYTS